jgi:ribosomal protein S18 acetylase RimI-like enzyme
LGVAAHDAVFVDDKAINVVGAARLGIHAVHHVTCERTVVQIQSLLQERPPGMMLDVPIPSDYAGMLTISRAVASEDWWGAVLMLAQAETTTDIAVLCDDPENLLLVARVGRQVAGTGLLMQPTPGVLHHTAELSVAVHSDYRRRGVARRLIEALLRAGARRGVQLVRAWVASADGASCALVEGLGFQEMARLKDELQHPDGRRFDVIVYSREIADA